MSQSTSQSTNSEVLLVLVSCPINKAEDIAGNLLESKLATCINIVPQVKSFYCWQGKVQQDIESLMLIKCPSDSYQALEERVLLIHPYELPEIITVSVAGGLPDYINWVLHPDQNKPE